MQKITHAKGHRYEYEKWYIFQRWKKGTMVLFAEKTFGASRD
jgi:hypothetical protein